MTFDEFLDAELPALTRYAAVLTGDRQRAHDVLADSLVKAHVGWRRIGSLQYPLAYVRRIITTTYVSEARRWSVRHIGLTATGELPETEVADPTAAFDDREHLSALLAALPPRQRAAVVLRFYLGLDNAAVATELGIREGAARTAISRGLTALRIAITAEGAFGVASDAGAAPAAAAAPASAASDGPPPILQPACPANAEHA